MKFAILSLLAFAAPLAAQQHAFTVMDMQAMQRVMDPRVSPDGKWVAFTVRTTDLEANKSRADLWLAATDGSGARQLTGDPANDADPRWLDARTLVFMSVRSGSSQLWTIGIDGGEARKLSDFPLDVENLNVIPGGRFLLSFNVWPKAKTLKESLDLDAAQAKRKTSARVYDELLQRHWDSWEDGKRNHWFSWKPGEEPKDLMPGVDADAPTLPFGEIGETSVSPDGKWVAFVQRVKGRENAWHTASDVFLVPADGSAPPRNVSEKNLGYDSTPSFSPDGHTLAWLSMPRAGYEADRQQIVLMDVGSGSRRELARDWDRSANEISWSPDGKTIFTSADNLGNVSLFAIDVMNGKVRTLVEKGRSGAPVAAGDAVVFQRDTLKSPAELFSVPAAGGEPRALTTINAERLAKVRLSDYEPYTFTGAHGDTVHGYVMKPDGFTEGRKYPTVMLIHGGPQGSFGDHFNYRWNPQAFAGAGFAVVFIDFHGSTGYGQAFCDAIRADWGGAPYEDLMKGLDAAIAKYAWMDGERVAAAGASYGGYMINWIAGQAPDRFKALVCHDGNLDERIAYFATEELWFPEWEHGIPWENPENYRKHNPIEHVQKWKTPQLVIHGARDYRVVDTGGLATFTALQRRGIPSRLVYFPDENHWVLKPQNSIEWYSQVLGWIKQWTAPEG